MCRCRIQVSLKLVASLSIACVVDHVVSIEEFHATTMAKFFGEVAGQDGKCVVVPGASQAV